MQPGKLIYIASTIAAIAAVLIGAGPSTAAVQSGRLTPFAAAAFDSAGNGPSADVDKGDIPIKVCKPIITKDPPKTPKK
jgi:hypothetical protein